MPKILRQGAEGRVYLDEYKGEKCLVKERFVKKYRQPELDTQITRQRMKAETKASERCRNVGILTPAILCTDLKERKIYMQYFERAITAKEYIKRLQAEYKNELDKVNSLISVLCERIGSNIGKMHANNIIHGDLTTMNILINPLTENDDSFEQYDIVFIDFGLSHYNNSVEDKGVDLYVLERALQLSTNSDELPLFTSILKNYRIECGKDESAVIAKFEEVRARGRKRNMIG